MNSAITQWAFGFGGWIGVFGGFFLLLNNPHNYTVLLLLLSPWLGAISLYLLMFMTFSWMNVCAQVTSAMVKQEIVVAVLTSFMGVLMVAIARFLIEMERGHRTPAQAAAEESAATIAALPPSPPNETETDETDDIEIKTEPAIKTATEVIDLTELTDSDNDSDNDSDSSSSSDASATGSATESSVGKENTEDTDKGKNDDNDEEDSEDSEENADSESSLNKARADSSYENIRTPQLSGIKQDPTVSPIPLTEIADC
jgi:hypothetical protein